VLLSLGSAHFRNGEPDAAEAEWKAAIEVNPKLGEAHNNLAVIYMTTGRLKEAEAEVKAAEKTGFRVNPQFKDDLKQRAAAQPRE
jgi:Flp pilus assembly protein TadD